MRRAATVLAVSLLAAARAVVRRSRCGEGDAPTANGNSIKTTPYVALGDSYSSAAGIAPFVAGAPATCSRSLLNYAHDIAAQTAPASFTDVTCSGAKTSDFFSPQAAGVTPQLDAVTKDTRLVTMTIGGNDGTCSRTRSSAAPRSRRRTFWATRASRSTGLLSLTDREPDLPERGRRADGGAEEGSRCDGRDTRVPTDLARHR